MFFCIYFLSLRLHQHLSGPKSMVWSNVQSLRELCLMFNEHYLIETQKIISERTESYYSSCTCQANSETRVAGVGIDYAFNANQI